jgi:uncharacterized protein YutE (UPF0331/DUF86 family)
VLDTLREAAAAVRRDTPVVFAYLFDSQATGIDRAIEAAIDAGDHIIASERFKTPETFAEVFVVLGDNGFLPKDGVEPLREMAGFRNVLVHGYADIDDGKVIDVLEGHLDDLTSFRKEIARSALGA